MVLSIFIGICQSSKKTKSFRINGLASAERRVIFKSLRSEDAASTDPFHRSLPRQVQPSMAAEFECYILD